MYSFYLNYSVNLAFDPYNWGNYSNCCEQEMPNFFYPVYMYVGGNLKSQENSLYNSKE